MSNKIIYHGSDVVVTTPSYSYQNSNPHNDYGKGFYCTQNLDMAKEWANRKVSEGFANKYSIDERGLKILDLSDKNKYSVLNWIAILIHHRDFDDDIRIEFQDVFSYMEKHYYIDIQEYDVVIGYRADDAYFRFPLMFIRNVLTLEKLEDIYLNGKLGKQYVLISEKAYKRIKFITAIPSESVYHDRYITRRDSADSSYLELEREERMSKGKRIKDLISEEND